MAQGLSNTGISRRLVVTEGAVENTLRASSASSAWNLPRPTTDGSSPCSGTSRIAEAQQMAPQRTNRRSGTNHTSATTT